MISYAKLATELGESDILELTLNQLKLDTSPTFGIFVNDLATVAASNNKNNIIELLSNNYLLDLQSQSMTLAETATKNDHYDTVEFLLSYIKEHDAEKLNDTFNLNETTYHLAEIAAANGHEELAEELAECANTQPERPPQLFDAIPNQDLLQRMGFGYD
ncbi:MAG: hypothetical protein EP298_13145 [Gammaproteobacteria bacterium]|nr:MAG: hypothetical protein EP298_13145 [Gammaproteobacteria bacterium]UTW41776.1 hypothetical protein KFE69_09690 [bacterium SCSIO 12844]